MINTIFRKECEQNNIPIISANTEDLIISILQDTKPKDCLEIGSAIGYSSRIIAQTILKRQGNIIGFEIAHNSYTKAISNNSNIHNQIIYPFDFTKTKLSKLANHTYDFIFIDGQKSQYKMYVESLIENSNDESIILLDDVIKFNYKLNQLYKFLNKMQIYYQIFKIDEDDGVMIIGNKLKINKITKSLNLFSF